MKKFIKINLIILVILCININFISLPIRATEDIENDEENIEDYENEAYEEIQYEQEENR